MSHPEEEPPTWRSEASCKHRGGGQGRGGGRGEAGRGGGRRRGAEGGNRNPPSPPLLDPPPPPPPPFHLPVIFRVDANDLPTSDQTEKIKGEKRERERDRRPINTFGGNSKSLQGKQRDSTLGSGQNSTPAERSVK